MYQQAQSRVQNGLNIQNAKGDKIKVVNAQYQKPLAGDIEAGLMYRCFFHRTISGKQMFTPCSSLLDTFFFNTIFQDYVPFIVITKYWQYFLCCTIHPCSLSYTQQFIPPYFPTPLLPFPCTSNHYFALYFCESASLFVIFTSLLYF